MVDSEREMLREDEEATLGERTPFESSRQATYEDSVGPVTDWGGFWDQDSYDAG